MDRPEEPTATADWQLEHYAAIGADYGRKHFTRPDTPYAAWILDRIASVQPRAKRIAEVGAGTCVFASLLCDRMQPTTPVVCYEPVGELLEVGADFDNVEAVRGDAVDFASRSFDRGFDLIFTKDSAHHFPSGALNEIHRGFCRNLAPGGRYLMVVRTPPTDRVPVGSIAASRWGSAYTSLSDLLASMRRVRGWHEVRVSRWRLAVKSDVEEWIEGIAKQDSWSIFSALDADEIAATVEELRTRFEGKTSFDFLHEYDVAVFEKY